MQGGSTALMHAAEAGAADVVGLLLDHLADVNEANKARQAMLCNVSMQHWV